MKAGLLLLVPLLLLAEQINPANLLRQAQDNLDHGHYVAARDAASRAAAAFQSAGDSVNRARALTVSGLADMYSGRYPEASHSFEEALETARATGDFGNEIGRLNDIGNLYYFQGLYSEAMARYQQAAKRVLQNPSNRWSAWARQITTANIAILDQTLGKNQLALDLYSNLLEGGQSLPPEEQAQLLSNVGVLRRRLGDPRKALETYREAQVLYRKSAHRDGEIAVLNNVGIVQAMDLNDLRAAENTFTESLRLAESSGSSPLVVHARLYRGEAFYRDNDLARSESDFRAAADQAHALSGREEEWKALYGLARIASNRGDKPTTTHLLDQAVGIIEDLRATAGAPSSLSGFLADKRAVYDLRIENTATAAEAFPWIEQSRARALQDRLGAPRNLSLPDFAATLPDDTAVLEYWTGSASPAVLWISRQSSGMRRVKVENAAITSAARAFSNPSRKDWREAARPLASLLEGIPVLQQSNIRRLVIVPDGLLAALPFEALPFADRDLLIQHFEITYAPFAAYLGRERADAGLRWPWQLVLAGFADPASSGAWAPLPDAARELQGIAALSGARSLLYTGGDARKQQIAAAAAAPVLHFATHGSANLQNSDLSYLVLAPAPGDTERFDSLYLREVNTLRLRKVDLVTLSACETESGKIVPGEGGQGFSQAFLGAGAQAVVASLWKVDDHAAAEFMLRFYRRLWKGIPLGQALRETKLDFLNAESSAHPAYWAAFTGTGDPLLQVPRVIRWTWIASAGAFLAVIAAVFLKRRSREVA